MATTPSDHDEAGTLGAVGAVGAVGAAAAGGAVPDEPARRLHPFTPFYRLISVLPRLAVPMLFALFAGGGDRTQLFLAAPLAIGTVYGFLAYVRFTYGITGGAIVVDEGVLTRKQRIVPLERIQQVDVQAKLLHRMLGVAIVKLDTAGGGHGADIDLTVVSNDEARRIQALVGRRRGGGEVAAAPESPVETTAQHDHADDVIVDLPAGELALAGITGGRLLVLLTVLGPLTEVLDEIPESFFGAIGAAAAERSTIAVALTAVVLGLMLWLGVAAGGSVLTYGGYRLVRRNGDLHLSCGLLDRREASLPLDRVQAVRISENVIRRALGRVSVRIQSGAVVGSKTQVTVPILRRDDVPALIGQVLPGVLPLPDLVRAPGAARRRAIVRRVLPTIAVAVVAQLVRPAPLTVAAGATATIIAIVAGELHYRGLGLGLGASATVVVGRAGGLARSTVVVPAAKAQGARVRSSPFQRLAGLATVTVAVAGTGPTPTIPDQDATRARAVASGVVGAAPAAAADERHERERVRRLAALAGR